jgi:hypothetical protein
MPIGALQRLAKHATPAAAPPAATVAGGDPNGTTAPAGTKTANDSPFANPLIAS